MIKSLQERSPIFWAHQEFENASHMLKGLGERFKPKLAKLRREFDKPMKKEGFFRKLWAVITFDVF